MSTSDRNSFGEQTTGEEVLAGIDLTGKTAFVTGTAGGLGGETARALAAHGASVTLGVRKMEQGQEVADMIRATVPGAQLDVAELDLSIPESVRQCADKWLEDHEQLHLLINNAGVMACPLTRTSEGWEMQFAANHLGHFVLTSHLHPALIAGGPGRVVNLSSGAHRLGNIDFDDIHFENREYNKFEAYGQSKTSNILFTRELDRRLQGKGVRSFAVHPGVIMTKLGRHMTEEDIQQLTTGRALTMKSPEAGAATTLYAATAPELEGQGGLYLEDCQIAPLAESEDAAAGYNAYAYDMKAAARLWEVSEVLVGEKFEI
ncbi:MAG: short-chain dehydrogenase [Gammaproteobacteria bacterium]|jgi:NAD(P)-dependent dehydrogenase (short-subunit alcohol dehydrogenase family)|nr:short-chain dehydrogenase [Gammaproteobacteria bacterium]|tara:strand:+ start:55 stop:1008 length:954 start_codon:yes stop_codon:yes gene_type:complete